MPSSYFTRISVGRQIHDALNDMKDQGRIKDWTTASLPDGRGCYIIHGDGGIVTMHTGELMDSLNVYGYDIRFGKDPRQTATMLEP